MRCDHHRLVLTAAQQNGSNSSNGQTSDNNSNQQSLANSSISGEEIEGVKRIASNGKTAGVDSWVVYCHSGSDTVIYNKSGKWSTGGLGEMGRKFKTWSRQEVAEYICN